MVIRRSMVTRLALLWLLATYSTTSLADWRWQDLFLSRDQQGRILFAQGDYLQAASRFHNPHWRALSLYAAEDFKSAADLWTQLPGAEALFNRGNALAHMEDYRGAADSYQLALRLRPQWQAAQDNLELVLILGREAKELDEYVPQSEGKMEADDFTFDKGSKRMEQALEDSNNNPAATSSKKIQAIWMERLQSTPADFLRLKFRYQHEMQDPSNRSEATLP